MFLIAPKVVAPTRHDFLAYNWPLYFSVKQNPLLLAQDIDFEYVWKNPMLSPLALKNVAIYLLWLLEKGHMSFKVNLSPFVSNWCDSPPGVIFSNSRPDQLVLG